MKLTDENGNEFEFKKYAGVYKIPIRYWKYPKAARKHFSKYNTRFGKGYTFGTSNVANLTREMFGNPPLVTDISKEDCLCPDRSVGAFSKYCKVHEPLSPNLIKRYPIPAGYEATLLATGGIKLTKKQPFKNLLNRWRHK